MNNAIEAICQSLSEKGQMIKNKVARSIDDLHQQDEVPQRVVLYQKSSPKAKILFVGGMFCLAAGFVLGVTNSKQDSTSSRIEQNNRTTKTNNHGLQDTASIILDILGVVGLCSGSFLYRKGINNKEKSISDKKVDSSRYASKLIESICSIKDVCSKEWDEAVMEHSRRCKQIIDTMECTEEEKIEKKESVTTVILIKYSAFEVQQLINSASLDKNYTAINDAVDVCSKKLQDAIDSAITQQLSIYKDLI